MADCGAFPNVRRPSVLWAGVGPLEPHLARLQSASETLAREAGLTPDEKVYRPHLTLARFRDRRKAGDVAGAVEGIRPYAPAPFDVNKVTLYRSDLTKSGARHTPIREVSL
jgi:2'-5' RNA ligase